MDKVVVDVCSCPRLADGPLAKIRSSSAVSSDSVSERRERGRLEGRASSPSLSREMNEFGREPDIWDGNDRAESDLRREKDYKRRRSRVLEKPEEAPDLILGLGELPAQ